MDRLIDALFTNVTTDKNLVIEMINKRVIINLQSYALTELQKKQLEFLIKVIGDASNEFYVDFWGNQYCHCDITTYIIGDYKISFKEWHLG